jgi:Zinc dependent phospholipase C
VPCFHTHWLVALHAIPAEPKYIVNGYRAYTKRTLAFRKALVDALPEKDFKGSMTSALLQWEKDIRTDDKDGSVTCFSAYMLGACGPDFWMSPSEPKTRKWSTGGAKVLPSFAHLHFDLGHYNRTHHQFEVSIEKVGGAGKNDPQSQAHRSYFLGMATHIAADLVIHQLVNVTAGAYNLLENRDDSKHDKVWENENGYLTVNIWNTHNKVEQYWDTYVRYRYLGDHGPFWPEKPVSDDLKTPGPWDDQVWLSLNPLGFPTVEGLIHEARGQIRAMEERVKAAEGQNQQSTRHQVGRFFHVVDDPVAEQRDANIKSLKTTLDYLKHSLKVLEKNADETRFAVEKPLMFPWLFADRVLNDDDPMMPFIYNVVVDKKTGAYPEAETFPAAKVEAESPQMLSNPEKDDKNYAEWQKLAWFASKQNKTTDSTTFNYLTFIVGPSVEQTRTNGRNVFYDYQALGPFVASAVVAAGKFVTELATAYKNGKPVSAAQTPSGSVPDGLGNLGRFWNLDTGLGLRVKQVASNTDHESVTLLDFVHVFEELRTPTLQYKRSEPYLAPWQRGNKDPVQKKGMHYSFTKAQAFKTYAHKPFADIQSVCEDKNDQYLEQILVEKPDPPPAKATLVKTAATKAENKLVQDKIKNRLTLCLRTAIADLKVPNAINPTGKTADCEEVALFLYGDKTFSAQATTEETRKWLEDTAKVLDYREQPVEMKRGLQVFTTRLLVNTKKETATDAEKVEREIAKGKWNNVVPYKTKKDDYGRNFAISTGRKFVLHPIDSGNFNPFTDFAYYDTISPTEQVFFTLYPLVKEDGDKYFDVFSKQLVPSTKLDEIKKIDDCGVVKLVLIYERTEGVGLNLKECYIDGLKAPVGSCNSTSSST